jgi:hypothetical protein
MHTHINAAHIISEKHRTKTTGCLFLLDSEKQQVQVYFANGEITRLKASNAIGIKALDKLASIQAISSQFHDGIETPHHDDIPNTLDIINKIKSAKTHQQAFILPKHLVNKAKTLFTEYAGPIADIIFEEQIERGTSLDQLIDTLSSYIDDDNDKKAFLHAAKDIS